MLKDLLRAVNAANSHFRYYKYRRSIKKPISIFIPLRQWPKQFIFQKFGIGNGAQLSVIYSEYTEEGWMIWESSGDDLFQITNYHECEADAWTEYSMICKADRLSMIAEPIERLH